MMIDAFKVEGVFLGWDLTSLTVWLWSVKHKKEMRMVDQQFYSHLVPFHNQSCLVNSQHLSDREVVSMHHEDAAMEVVTVESNDEEVPPTALSDPSQLSQLATQPAPSALNPSGQPPASAPVLSPVPSLPSCDKAHGPGAVPLENVPIQQLSDMKLARAYGGAQGRYQKCTALPVLAYSEKKFTYLNTEILDPPDLLESTELQLQVSTGKWNFCSLLNINFHYLKTLWDVGLSARTKALASAIHHWSEVGGVTHSPFPHTVYADVPTCSAHAWRDDLTSGLFKDPEDNTLWCSRVLAGITDTDYLSTVNALEQDLKSHHQAMKHPCLKPFWLKAKDGEMTGLWDCGCLHKVRKSELTNEERKHIFHSKFHYKIKRSGCTGRVTKCKASIVVLGNHMTQG
eukprot:642367-Rhodomonas_salina.3